jgi:hypothetical protein
MKRAPYLNLSGLVRPNVHVNPARTMGKLIIESAVLAIFVYVIIVLAFA